MRTLYSLAGMQFVFPDPVIRGSYKIIPDEESFQDALKLKISTNGISQDVQVLGSKGVTNDPKRISLGGLDFWVGENVYQIDSGLLTITGRHPKIIGEVVEYNVQAKTLSLTHIGTDSALAEADSDGLIGFTVGKTVINKRPSDQLVFPHNIFYGRNVDSNTYLHPRIRTILSVNEDTGYLSAQNDVFNANDNANFVDFLDFSEGNPFGDAEDT